MKEILVPLNFTTTPTVYDTKQSFSTSDEASGVLTFTTTADVAGTVASLTIRNASENANRQTVLIERLDVNSSPFSYTLKNPLPFGQYEGTVLLKKNLTVIASATFLFGVNSSLSAEVLPDLVKAYALDELVENVETEVSNLKDAFNLTVSETVKGVNKTENTLQAQENVRYLNEHTRKTNEESRIANENARIAAELLRKDTFDTLVDSAVIEETVAQEVANEFQQIESTYANRLLSTEQQLAETNAQVDLLNRGLGETFATLTDLQTAYPTGDTKDHIVAVDGHRYFWNETTAAWADGGAYQAVEVLDKTVTPEKTDFFAMPINLFDKTAITTGKYLLKTGVISSDYPLAFVSDKMKMKANLKYAIPYEYRTGTRIRLEDAFGNLLAVFSEDAGSLPTLNGIISYPQDCYAIISQTSTANLNTWMFIQSDVIINIANYIPYHAPYIPKEAIENLTTIETDVTDLKADVTEILEVTDVFDDTLIGSGDSLTAGTGGNGTTYLTVVQSLLTANGKTTTTINRGGGGETCNGINSRIGAFPIILNPFTLPADTSTVVVTTKMVGGETVNNLNRFMRGINPCYIDGIECTLSRLSDLDNTLYLKRNVAGTSVVFDRPKRLIPNGYLNDRNAKIFVIWMGTNNDTYTAEQIIQKQRLFVDTIKTDKFIILGITQDNEPNRITHNNAMAQEWGARFLDIREYVIEYGLQDMSITPTTADTEAIALGKIPPSLLYDDTHFNEFGYTVIGQEVYKTIDKLGFLV